MLEVVFIRSILHSPPAENQSETGFEAGPRRLEFSPPTKQPRPPGVQTSSEWSDSEEQADSVVDETLRYMLMMKTLN